MAAKFEIYTDKSTGFRWRLTHTNGRIIADSGQGYKAKEDAIKGISSLKENVPNAVIVDSAAA